MSWTRANLTAAIAATLLLAACGEEQQATGSRGMGDKSIKKKGGDEKKGAEKKGGKKGADKGPKTRPKDRPKIVLTRADFATPARDPFQSWVDFDASESEPAAVSQRQRDVRMREYNFDDLKLIGVVNSGRNVVPRALFLANDGKSKTIHQGEYFSRAEVLLASVNRDYVEIEVVDEELAQTLNLERGERRAIYLETK